MEIIRRLHPHKKATKHEKVSFNYFIVYRFNWV
jgi:hypothetical protein